MDHRSALIENEISVDQAIFTSLPSMMGEGYRLVAASHGLKPDEKAEIIRHSPSHNSLCSESPNSKAYAVYRLTSGRFVFACSCLAGHEHTARGERIYTHLVVLKSDDYQFFAFNPLPILQAIDQNPNLKPESRLELFALVLPTSAESVNTSDNTSEPDEITINHLCLIVSSLSKNQRLIVTNIHDDFSFLNCLLNALAPSLREKLTFSFGLNYSPSRNFQLIFLNRDDPQTRRLIRGQNIEWLNLSDPEHRPTCPLLRPLKQV
jgi:hypothetical protein